MVRRRNAIVAVLVLLFAFTGVCVVAFLDRGGSGSLGSTLAIGILASLAASMFVSVTGIVFQVRPANPSRESGFDGVVAVRPKKALTPEEWLGLLREARTEFFIAGHSLRKWCEASNQQEFKSKIRSILDDGGRVTLVMLAADSPQIGRLQDATSRTYTAGIKTSLAVLGQLWAALSAESRDRLTIAALDDDVMLPYMVVGNERRLMTATYLASTDSDDSLCLELTRTSDAATAVYDDFCRLAEAGNPPELPAVAAPPSAPAARARRLWGRRRRP